MTQKHALYLHIPFCKSICTYCAFNTYADMEQLIPDYVKALQAELQILSAQVEKIPLSSIFFGGGTPSVLTAQQFEQLMTAIYARFEVDAEAEISLEANPNDIHEGYLRDLRLVGLNRLSLGMQSAQARELALFNRRHDTIMTRQAVTAARKAGFDNLSLDLIFGIPEQSLEDWRNSLQEAVALTPEHVSLYGLELKGGTVLKEQVKRGEVPKPNDDLSADMYDLATDMLGDAGFEQYEISNWSRVGYQARHNLQYWRNLPYLGVGAGAHGYAGGVRTIVLRSPSKYIEKLQQVKGRYPFPRTPTLSKVTPVTPDAEMSETLMMGLRLLQEGIQRSHFRQRFGMDVYDARGTVIDKYVRLGMLELDESALRLTRAGRFVSNAILADLI